MHIKTLIRAIFFVCLLGSLAAQSAQPAANVEFKLANRYHVGGDEKWDLLAFDAQRHRLFISRFTHVQVVDTDSGKVIGEIPGTDGVHGIALADDLNTGFTSNGKSNSVTAFDLATLKVIATINISGLNPDVILYEPKSKHIFTFNGRSANATVIDALSLKQIDTIALPGKPELAVSDNAGKVFVNIEDKNEIAVIDGVSNKVLGSYTLGNGVEPTGLAIDRQHDRLFSVCANRKMVILDSVTGKIISEIAIGEGPDSVAFDQDLGIAFSSNGDGTLTAVKEDDPDHFSVLKNIKTQKGARTMAYDAVKHRAYLVTASFGQTPPASAEQPKPRPAIIPHSFVVLVISSHP
jgi:YVTN family beta-propeller protein